MKLPRLLIVIALLAVGIASLSAQPAGSGWQALTQPVSASVLATTIIKDGRIALLVLWQGTPAWFANGRSNRTSYFPRGGSVAVTLEYGGHLLEMQYDPGGHAVAVQRIKVPLPNGHNVLLVDGLAPGGSPRIVSTVPIAVPASTAGLTYGALFRPSPQIVEFLRCDVAAPNEAVNRVAASMACDELTRTTP